MVNSREIFMKFYVIILIAFGTTVLYDISLGGNTFGQDLWLATAGIICYGLGIGLFENEFKLKDAKRGNSE